MSQGQGMVMRSRAHSQPTMYSYSQLPFCSTSNRAIGRERRVKAKHGMAVGKNKMESGMDSSEEIQDGGSQNEQLHNHDHGNGQSAAGQQVSKDETFNINPDELTPEHGLKCSEV